MTSTVRRITSTTKLNNARMNVSNARVSSRFIRYIRVAAPCICFVPWAALASCRPRPQQQLPVSAAGGGRCRCRAPVPPQRLRAGAPPPGHSLEKLPAVLPGSAPDTPARCAKPCLKCRLRLKSTEKPDGKCEDFSRWWSGERRRDGVNGDNAALRQNRYTFCSNYAIL